MVMQETGGRTAEEIAATFPDPADAANALSLQMTDWQYNSYRVYVAQTGATQDTPARIEVSLHQFSSAGGAAYMLPYFADGRADLLGQRVQSPWVSGPCTGWVVGTGESTLYVRINDLLVRATVVAQPSLPSPEAYYLTLQVANNVVAAVLANAGTSRQFLDQTCQ